MGKETTIISQAKPSQALGLEAKSIQAYTRQS